ncbi:tetratricopeptide repeat protein [Jiella pacifica]|uniref:Tetratricopeptide repeat protein n=1 Tax=Jiella pacifica TaxID=2696469 RepID=A0A6N9TCB1_9HYPH|nr:tetratricopeptide repeat protein [Jiella pacifica]NDW07865.1 tetratricopeptide repeat protein [Jiella pacifica]
MARPDLIAPIAAAGVFLAAAFGPAMAEPAAAPAAEAAPSGGSGEKAVELDRLFAALKTAPNEAAGRAIEDRIWRRWMQAPDRRTENLVREAMARREVYDFAGARALLDEAVAGAPRYAEAYNQRGFVLFLQEDFDAALADVDRAIELEPRHFAAMAGRALILMRQGRHRLAQTQLRRAVEIHPFLKERGLIVGEPAKPARPGVDL